MIQARFNWNGETALFLVLAGAWDGIRRAVVFYHNSLLLALNKANPKPYQSGAMLGDKAGDQGDPPRTRTGLLKPNVISELDPKAMEARVGLLPGAIYGLFLELARKQSRKRPWLLRTLEKVFPQMQALARPKEVA